eukprot:gene17920-36603_t
MNRSKKVAYLPFGTPIHGKHPYSEYAHLAAANRDFALEITTSVIPPEINPKAEPDDALLSPTSRKKAAAALNGLQSSGELKPCARSDCKEVSRKITDAQEKNQNERELILRESKRLVAELEQIDQVIQMTDSEQKQYVLENSQIEKNLSQLGEALKALEKTKQEQQQERDELNNK